MNDIEAVLREIEDRVRVNGSRWGSCHANVAEDAKHQLCKIATYDVSRLIAAVKVAIAACERVRESHPSECGPPEAIAMDIMAGLNRALTPEAEA